MSVSSQPSLVDSEPGPAQQRGLKIVPLHVQQRFVEQEYPKSEFFQRWRHSVGKPNKGLVKGWTIHDQLAMGPRNAFGNVSQEERRYAPGSPYLSQGRNGSPSQFLMTSEVIEEEGSEEMGGGGEEHGTPQFGNIILEEEDESSQCTAHCECCRFNEEAEPLQGGRTQGKAWEILALLWFIAVINALQLAFAQTPPWIANFVKEGDNCSCQ